MLLDFKRILDEEHHEVKQKADRHLAANKVLAKALHILKSNSAASEARAESELADLRTQLAQSEDRAKVHPEIFQRSGEDSL